MRHLTTALAALYAGLIYLFIFLPVVVLVLFSSRMAHCRCRR
jgi:spermidine/putrescine transport system permease protein